MDDIFNDEILPKTEKRGRKKLLNQHLVKNNIVRFGLDDYELETFKNRKTRLSISSPTLSASGIFREVAKMISDPALIMFLQLEREITNA